MSQRTLLQLAVMWCVLCALLTPAAAADVPCQSCWTDACPKLQGLVPKCPPPPLVCKGGREKVNGHCCFPGQTWSGSCKGLPRSCPDGYSPSGDDCQLAHCQDGRERAADQIHCCWPGQKWNPKSAKCEGRPASCPTFWSVDPASSQCLRPPECEPARVRSSQTEGHCCWPGQGWFDNKCTGTPSSCPADMVADEEQGSCIVPNACTDGREWTQATRGHCCWPGQTWDEEQCKGQPSSCPDGHFAGPSACEKGPDFCLSGREWSQATLGHCCWRGQMWKDGRCSGVSQCPDGLWLHFPTLECVARPCPANVRSAHELEELCGDKPPASENPSSMDRTQHHDRHEFLGLFSTSGAAYYGWAGNRSYTAVTAFGTETAKSDPVGAFAWSHKFAYTHRLYFSRSPWSLLFSGALTYTLLVPAEPINCSPVTFGIGKQCNSAAGLVMQYPPPPPGHDIALEGTVLVRRSGVGFGAAFGAEFYANGPQATPYALPMGPMLSLYRERSVQFRVGWRPLLGSLYDIQADLTLFSRGHFAASFYYLMKARDTTDAMAPLASKLFVTAGLSMGFYYAR